MVGARHWRALSRGRAHLFDAKDWKAYSARGEAMRLKGDSGRLSLPLAQQHLPRLRDIDGDPARRHEVTPGGGLFFVLHRRDIPADDAAIAPKLGQAEGLQPNPRQRHRALAAWAAGGDRVVFFIWHLRRITEIR
jgi:hypothetical protein